MVGTLFAYLNYRSMKKRWVFIGVSIVTPLVANWLRAYMIVMIGHLSGNKLAVGVDHIIYGWVFFGLIMLAMFMIGARWQDPDPVPVAPAAGSGSPTVAGSTPRLGLGALTLPLALALLALPAGGRFLIDQATQRGVPQLAAPAQPGWSWVNEPMSTLRPHFVNPVATLHGRYEPQDGGSPIGLYIGYYRDQRPGHKLVTSVNAVVNAEEDKEWSVTRSSLGEVGGQPWVQHELRGQALGAALSGMGSAPRLKAWQVYWINGRPFASDWQAKLYGASQTLIGRGDDAAVVVLYVDKDAAGADDARLKAFVTQLWPALDTALRGVRDLDSARKP